jgi:hypothetical protein
MVHVLWFAAAPICPPRRLETSSSPASVIEATDAITRGRDPIADSVWPAAIEIACA